MHELGNYTFDIKYVPGPHSVWAGHDNVCASRADTFGPTTTNINLSAFPHTELPLELGSDLETPQFLELFDFSILFMGESSSVGYWSHTHPKHGGNIAAGDNGMTSRIVTMVHPHITLVWPVHCLGHKGMAAAYGTLKGSHCWPNVFQEGKLWIHSYPCLSNQQDIFPVGSHEGLPLHNALKELNDGYDHMDNSCLVNLDGWPKFCECLHLRELTISDVNDIFKVFVANYGNPTIVKFDNGPEHFVTTGLSSPVLYTGKMPAYWLPNSKGWDIRGDLKTMVQNIFGLPNPNFIVHYDHASMNVIAQNIVAGKHTGEVWIVPEHKSSPWWKLLNAQAFISWLRLKDDGDPVLIDKFGNAVNTMYNLFAVYIRANTMTREGEQAASCLDVGMHSAKIHQ